jgi:glutamate-1-semialdehyde 2,1-aminomutase
MSGLRSACDEAGALLVFDEVVTGFRLAYGGAQAYYGVQPDLVAYGKALGGGLPIGAYGGRRDIMRLVREDDLGGPNYVWTASTLGGNPVSCAAGCATLALLRRDGAYEQLHAIGEYLRQQMRVIASERGLDTQIIGDGPLAQMIFTPEPVSDYRSSQSGDAKLARRVMLELFQRGVFLNPMGTKLYLSLAHAETDCDAFCDRLDASLSAALQFSQSG